MCVFAIVVLMVLVLVAVVWFVCGCALLNCIAMPYRDEP